MDACGSRGEQHRADSSHVPAQLHDAMGTAIDLGARARGATSPNPPVGCVILDVDGNPVGSGATQPPGGPHAEVLALRAAGAAAAGGTAVVTLEPCAHAGRTPPCADTLVRAGVERVVYAVADPHRAAAGGASRLRAAGVTVHGGVRATEVEQGALRGWLHFIRTGRPHVTWKYAATMDGRSAAADGSSQWISSAVSRSETHGLRGEMDAIVVGTGTVLADDPRLTARDDTGELRAHQPLRVVLGQRPIPDEAAINDSSAETIQFPMRDPEAALRALAERGVVDVLLEGGPRLAGGFIAAQRVERILGYIAPMLLGAGPTALGETGVGTIADAWRWHIEEVTRSGPDLRVSAVPVDHPDGADSSTDRDTSRKQ